MANSDIFFVRLKNGDDLVSEAWTLNNGKIYVFVKPMKLYYSYELQSEEDTSYKGFGLQLAPWVYPTIAPSQKFEISWTEILTMSSPSNKILREYQKALKWYLTPDKPKKQIIVEQTLEDLDEPSRKALERFVSEQLENISRTIRK